MTPFCNLDKTRRFFTLLIFLFTSAVYLLTLSNGFSTWTSHLVSLLLHALNATLVFLLALKVLPKIKSDTFGSDRTGSSLTPFIFYLPSLLAALIFALHPVNVEAVSWVGATNSLIYASFLFISLLFFFKARAKGAAAGKEKVLSLGFFILFAYFLLADNSFTGISGLSLSINIFPSFFSFITKLVVPMNLSAVYEFDPVTSIFAPSSLAGVFLCALFIFLFFFFRKTKVLPLALALIVLPLLPQLYGSGVSTKLFAERYLYLSSAGLALFYSYWFIWFTGEVVVRHKKRGAPMVRLLNSIVMVPMLAVLIIFFLNSTARMHDWKDELTLWLSAVANNNESSVAHYNAGKVYVREDKLPEAFWHFQNAGRLDPTKSRAFFYIGDIMFVSERFDDAIHYFKIAISKGPEIDAYQVALARAYLAGAKPSEAIIVLESLLKKRPDMKEALKMIKEARSRL